jgi:hypothetical protein
MAALEVTKKLLIYHTLYRLNVSFSNIVTHCRTLHEAGILKSKDSRLYEGLAQELQSDINEALLDPMHQIELDDWARFGKVSEAREKRLRDPDDLPLLLEEQKAARRKKNKK